MIRIDTDSYKMLGQNTDCHPKNVVSLPLRHQCFPFHLYVQFDVAINHFVVTSNVDMVDDCNVCDDVWPVCYDVVNIGLRYTVYAFQCPFPHTLI